MGKHYRSKSRKRPCGRSPERSPDSDSSEGHRGNKPSRAKRSRRESRAHRRRSPSLLSHTSEHPPISSLEGKLDVLLNLLSQSGITQGITQESHPDEPNLYPVPLGQNAGDADSHGDPLLEENSNPEASSGETVQQKETEEGHASTRCHSVSFAPEITNSDHDIPASEQEVAAFKRDLLGVDPDDSATGSPVHELISKTWSSIFTSGLSKDTRLALRKKYLTPHNLLLARAPTLNIEVRRAIPMTSLKRDEYHVITQGIVESAIAAQAYL